ncbi:MAG: DUF6969 family protein [Betaproteobacteria bacterium]
MNSVRQKAVDLPDLQAPDTSRLSARRLREMLTAGIEALECRRALERGGINLVSELLRGQGDFVEYEHYPRDDVYDAESGAQYYYHAHRGIRGEHGHFHTFIRDPGWQADRNGNREAEAQSCGDGSSVTHLIAISMDAYGWPIGLFATNHWVTGGTWRTAESTINRLPRFRIDHAYPSWPVNRWLGAMFTLFRPHIESLLRHRDQVIAAWGPMDIQQNVLEDRALEITGFLSIDVERTVHTLRESLMLQH